MPSSEDATPIERPITSRTASHTIRLPKNRISADGPSMTSSTASLLQRPAGSAAASLFASTSIPFGSRPVSPSGTSTPTRTIAGSIFGGPTELQIPPPDRHDDPRNIVIEALVPHIAIHSSSDTDDLVKDKGFEGGFWELLRPFGDQVQGKVTVRESGGYGKTYEDFSVRFVQLGDGLETAAVERSIDGRNDEKTGQDPPPAYGHDVRIGGNIRHIDELVDRHLNYAEDFPSMSSEEFLNLHSSPAQLPSTTSPFYALYVRKMLSSIPMCPHETFSHPVACIIAISSRNKSPIEALRRLYDEATRGDKRLPMWVNAEYLRYYVLVHDEERDDISASMTLFEQMKRHFGLHCHLLRLRSSACVATDDDSIQLPRCRWTSASEELAELRSKEDMEDPEDTAPYIFESDVLAIKTFIREMVTQSVVPSMERCVTTWNDQVASRRRGLSGKFMSLSKKWSGFGAKATTGSSNANSDYDALQGFYRQDTPEAIMRKLADYAFMLRDWKLAQSTYDLLRADFNNDKAWKYHAAANEMAAVSALLVPVAMTFKTRAETVDLMLETASYSYLARCNYGYGGLRCLMLGMELLRLRGGSATDDAARWAGRLLEQKITGPVGDALIKERIATCHSSKLGTGSMRWGARTRKAAMWNVLAADTWLLLNKPQQAKPRFIEADAQYASMKNTNGLEHYDAARKFLDSLHLALNRALYIADSSQATIRPDDEMHDDESDPIEVHSEEFLENPRRRSLMGASLATSLETATLHDLQEEKVPIPSEHRLERNEE